MRASIAVVSAVFLLSGCASQPEDGRLSGPEELPPALNAVYIQSSEPNSVLLQTLRNELRGAGIQVADARNQATAVLNVSRETVEYRAGGGTWTPVFMNAGYSSSGGSASYQLHYGATFVLIVDGREMFFPETVDLYRNQTGPLGNALQQQAYSLGQNLARDMVRALKRRVAGH